MVSRLATDVWRRLQRWRGAMRLLGPAADTEPADESAVLLQRALRGLPTVQRKALALHYLFDMPVAQIALMGLLLMARRAHVWIRGQQSHRWLPHRGKDVPAGREWYEPRREPKRPAAGYIGLQTHDPGDVVDFKEVSVRPLPAGK